MSQLDQIIFSMYSSSSKPKSDTATDTAGCDPQIKCQQKKQKQQFYVCVLHLFSVCLCQVTMMRRRAGRNACHPALITLCTS